MRSSRLFTADRHAMLGPLKTHRRRVMADQDEFERMTRASEIMLNAEEPSIRTYYCAKSVVMEFIDTHPNDPRGYKELGKVHLYSCVSENIDLAEQVFRRVQSLSGGIDAEAWYLISMCHQLRLFGSYGTSGTPDDEPSEHDRRGEHQRAAEQALKLALKHAHGSAVYRLALAEFYVSTDRRSKASRTRQCAHTSAAQHSPPEDTAPASDPSRPASRDGWPPSPPRTSPRNRSHCGTSQADEHRLAGFLSTIENQAQTYPAAHPASPAPHHPFRTRRACAVHHPPCSCGSRATLAGAFGPPGPIHTQLPQPLPPCSSTSGRPLSPLSPHLPFPEPSRARQPKPAVSVDDSYYSSDAFVHHHPLLNHINTNDDGGHLASPSCTCSTST